MVSKNLVICDQEDGYASAFAGYIMDKKELAFQVQTCSDIAHVLSVQKEGKIDYLFISAECPKEVRKKVKADKVFVLADHAMTDLTDREILLYKYQSGEELLAELIRQCSRSDTSEGGFLKTVKKKQGRIIGVFSPVHRIGKTTYALMLGEELASRANVLYLNMELYGGREGYFAEGGQCLSDVLYYVRQEQGNLGLILTTLVKHRNHLDYVSPVQVSEDIKSVSLEEWRRLIRKIMEESIYEVLILDLDEGIRDVYDILEMCTEIHMPVTKDEAAEAKIRQFEEEIVLLGKEDIRRKIIRKEQ
ncbi:hypothetical protein JQM69_10665 [Faecalicatena contorta]|uniref:hypothetical protein n=1 Tax=Faecalicatena contorta TaxID=39482 RepID=UPI001F3D0DC6|nr:hypothetical protein [Faecalicatena contorta]MCF2681135.1 hypothetical protein [Faecalicatena contorta]